MLIDTDWQEGLEENEVFNKALNRQVICLN